MIVRTEYAVRYTGRQHGKPTTLIHQVRSAPGDQGAAQQALDYFRETHDVNAVIVARTVTTTEWEPMATRGFEVGDRVVYTSPQTGTAEAGWEFAGPDRSLPSTIRDGLVTLRWVGSDRNMVAHSVDPANLTLDTTHADQEVA